MCHLQSLQLRSTSAYGLLGLVPNPFPPPTFVVAAVGHPPLALRVPPAAARCAASAADPAPNEEPGEPTGLEPGEEEEETPREDSCAAINASPDRLLLGAMLPPLPEL